MTGITFSVVLSFILFVLHQEKPQILELGKISCHTVSYFD